MRAYIKVERDWHCFHCQIEDNVCNGTETPDACKFQGCKLGISLCRQVDVCARDTPEEAAAEGLHTHTNIIYMYVDMIIYVHVHIDIHRT